MSKTKIALLLSLPICLGFNYLLKEHDPLNYWLLQGKLRFINDSLRNVHQHVRKRELFASAHGEVVELNAGAGNTLPLLPPTVSRYYANEINPTLIKTLKDNTKANGVPISHIENCSSLELLRAIGNNTMDTVILNGALRFERPQQNQRIFNEIHRVLRPGGFLLFSEDIAHGKHQTAPLQALRRAIRNIFTGEVQTEFVPPLLRSFDSAFVEDWTRPPLGFHESHRVGTKVALDFHQRHDAEENIGEYFRLLPKWDFSFLHRPTYGGWTVKKTKATGDKELIEGRVSLQKLSEFTALLSTNHQNDVQLKRDQRAQNEGYEADGKIMQNMKAAMDRATKKKPTQPKPTYKELAPIPVTLWSALVGSSV
jgi:SAM-dependent methyltransferase